MSLSMKLQRVNAQKEMHVKELGYLSFKVR